MAEFYIEKKTNETGEHIVHSAMLMHQLTGQSTVMQKSPLAQTAYQPK